MRATKEVAVRRLHADNSYDDDNLAVVQVKIINQRKLFVQVENMSLSYKKISFFLPSFRHAALKNAPPWTKRHIRRCE